VTGQPLVARRGTTATGSASRSAHSRPVPAAFSTAIAPLVRGPERPMTVLASFARAVYLSVGGELVALVTADGIRHPNAAVLATASTERPLAGLRADQRGVIGGGRVRVGDLDVCASRWWDPRPRLRPCTPDALQRSSAVSRTRMHEIAGATSDPLVVALAMVVAAMKAHDLEAALAAADRLIGLGPGLTPAGDDMLAGLVSGTVLLADVRRPGDAVRYADGVVPEVSQLAGQVGLAIAAAAVGRTTSVSAALLRHAARGQVADPAADLLRAWVASSDLRAETTRPGTGATSRNPADGMQRILDATDRLLAIGASSGRDLALGLLAAVDLVAGAPAAPPASPSIPPTSPSIPPTSPSIPPTSPAERTS
jgi:hypothetical protein